MSSTFLFVSKIAEYSSQFSSIDFNNIFGSDSNCKSLIIKASLFLAYFNNRILKISFSIVDASTFINMSLLASGTPNCLLLVLQKNGCILVLIFSISSSVGLLSCISENPKYSLYSSPYKIIKMFFISKYEFGIGVPVIVMMY